MSKLRIWWMPQVPMESFYIPVTSVLEGKKILDMLAAYDAFQLQHKVKTDYTNMGGLQEYNEETKEWNDWYSVWEMILMNIVSQIIVPGKKNQKNLQMRFSNKLTGM